MQLNIWSMAFDLIKVWAMMYKMIWPYLLIGLLLSALPNMPRWYWNHRAKTAGVDKVDSMKGEEFEIWLERQFKKAGYGVKRTPYQGDHGADLIATNTEGTKIAVQAKKLRKRKDRVGAKALGEVLRGKKYYKCDKAMMVTNQGYTQQARDEARKFGIELIDRKKLIEFTEKVNSKPKK